MSSPSDKDSPGRSTSSFHHFAKCASRYTGHPAAFGLAVAVVLIWMVSGPFFGYSDTWQLVINTGTTIITFLMVFLIQNTQNKDTTATQIKLDELIRAVEGAQEALLDMEEFDESDLEKMRERYERLAKRAREQGVNIDPEPTSPERDTGLEETEETDRDQ